MTIAEFTKRLGEFNKKIVDQNIPFQKAVNSTTQLYANRIFVDGQPEYKYNDTDPLYINPKKSAGNTSKIKPPKGKYGDKKFKNGKEHKTTYVESYKKYRELIGRESERVTLFLSGDLASDTRNAPMNKTATATKVDANNYLIRLDRPVNQKKYAGLKNKYPELFKVSAAEKANINRVALQELINQLNTSGLA